MTNAHFPGFSVSFVTMSETQGQNGKTEPQSAGASNSTGSGTVIVRGIKPMKPPKRGRVKKQIWNDMRRSLSTETTSL
ncbi:hypothetical protein E2542_SST20522 [Spatholobus suberectus]|nr:hypothetical protein E2542_SST20522 [Spatholobus suberectus]